MRKLDLEFMDKRRVPWAGLAFLGANVIWGSVLGAEWFDLKGKEGQDLSRILMLEHERGARQRMHTQNAALQTPEEERRDKEHKAMLSSLGYSWNQVFAEIEQSNIEHLAVLAFTHDQATRTNHLTVEALDMPTLTRYVQILNDGHPVARWYIESYKMQLQSAPPTMTAHIVSR